LAGHLRHGPEGALALHYAAGILFIALIALAALPCFALLVVIFFAGTTIIGSQTGANGACGALYPARMRTTGIGWAIGIGRVGSIASPILGGHLLARGLPPTQIFLSACFFALAMATATALLVLRGRSATRLAEQSALALALAQDPNRLTLSEACVASSNVSETARGTSGRRRQWRS
jgi:AAHS family 4-hydroxybenzoate transporter-like MFS transporter